MASEAEIILRRLLPLVDTTAPGIFRLSGNNTRQIRIIEAIKCGQNIDVLEKNSHDVATIVKQVIREYPGRLFDSTTESILSRLVKNEGENNFLRLQETLNTLSPDRISFLQVVLPFLNKVSLLADVNRMDAGNLARVIALDFFPDISNPLGADSTVVRQVIDWRIKIMEKLITSGETIVPQRCDFLANAVPETQAELPRTPIYNKSESTTSVGEASQKRKRPPQSPLKAVWNGFANIFSKTPRPGRPESTPPNGTPSFFSKFSNRLCPSGKKVKHNEEDDFFSGYRSDDNTLRCPPVKQNLRSRFSHKKKSPKLTTPGRLKTPSTPYLMQSGYGTFSGMSRFQEESEVRTELFGFSQTLATDKARGEEFKPLIGVPFVFSSKESVCQPSTSTSPTIVMPPNSPVRISPDPEPEPELALPSSEPILVVDENNEANDDDESAPIVDVAMESCTADAVMESISCETETSSCPAMSTASLVPSSNKPEPSPSLSHLDEMRDSLSDLLNIGVTPRCRQPVVETKQEFGLEPVIETTFDAKNAAEKRLIAQVRRQLGPVAAAASSGSRRPSVANLERMGQVSQGRRLWEHGGPSAATLNFNAFAVGAGDAEAKSSSIQQSTYPRLAATSSKRQTDL